VEEAGGEVVLVGALVVDPVVGLVVVLVVHLAVVAVGLLAAAVVAVVHLEGEDAEEDEEALVVLRVVLESLLSPIVMLVFLSLVRRRTC